MLAKMFTLFFEKRALLITGSTACTVRHANPLLFQIMGQREVSATHITVHAARRNEIFGEHVLNRLFQRCFETVLK